MDKIEISEGKFFTLIKEGVKDFSSYIMPEVTELHCSINNLTSLPELPKVTYLNCSINNLTSLPELPKVTRLHCYVNKLTSLPELPEVTHLICSYNNLTSLPDLPKIKYLECHNNPITGNNFLISPTSGRPVYYFKSLDKLITGCFKGTLEEFYLKGFIEESKQWVKDFYELNK